ncbi:MAG: tetratricopeptide repeat protein [Gammaproteobacteria bacterium]|nr:tetratricopeptide repeat protein [Gammaproteobacteria bacterium]
MVAVAGVWLARKPADGLGELSAGVMAGLKGQAPMPMDSGHPPPTGAPQLPSLNDLLPGLEAKVAANPRDVDSRLLLAQTYAEVGQRDKALKNLKQLRAEQPGNGHVAFVSATVLMAGGDPGELRQAFDLLEQSRKQPALSSMARLQQGEIRLRQGDAAGARTLWQNELRQLAPDDRHRGLFEAELAKLNVPTPKN